MKQRGPLAIYTVDDSEIIYRNLGSLLKENRDVLWVGHSFTIRDAFTEIPAVLPSVVILDIQLGEENSFGLLEFLTSTYPDIKVIMLTNLSTDPYRKRCDELGAAYFLDKSTEFEKIASIIKEHIQAS